MKEAGGNEHLANKPILINTPPLPTLGFLSPHLLDILQDHIAVTIKRFYACEQFAVVAA